MRDTSPIVAVSVSHVTRASSPWKFRWSVHSQLFLLVKIPTIYFPEIYSSGVQSFGPPLRGSLQSTRTNPCHSPPCYYHKPPFSYLFRSLYAHYHSPPYSASEGRNSKHATVHATPTIALSRATLLKTSYFQARYRIETQPMICAAIKNAPSATFAMSASLVAFLSCLCRM